MNAISKKLGPFELSVSKNAAGEFMAKISLSGSLGGGEAAGVVKVAGSLEADISAAQIMELGFAELDAILPAAVLPMAETAEAVVENEVKKI